jgi:hypothetical protein
MALSRRRRGEIVRVLRPGSKGVWERGDAVEDEGAAVAEGGQGIRMASVEVSHGNLSSAS